MQCYGPYRVAGNWGSGVGAEYAHVKARPITGLDGGKEHVGRIRQSFEWSLSSQRDAGLNLCAMILTKDDGVILPTGGSYCELKLLQDHVDMEDR